MPFSLEHLSILRQEMTDLLDMNARCLKRGGNSALDRVAIELRTSRVREIEQELSKILKRP